VDKVTFKVAQEGAQFYLLARFLGNQTFVVEATFNYLHSLAYWGNGATTDLG
jgi:hypothetical protein